MILVRLKLFGKKVNEAFHKFVMSTGQITSIFFKANGFLTATSRKITGSLYWNEKFLNPITIKLEKSSVTVRPLVGTSQFNRRAQIWAAKLVL